MVEFLTFVVAIFLHEASHMPGVALEVKLESSEHLRFDGTTSWRTLVAWAKSIHVENDLTTTMDSVYFRHSGGNMTLQKHVDIYSQNDLEIHGWYDDNLYATSPGSLYAVTVIIIVLLLFYL